MVTTSSSVKSSRASDLRLTRCSFKASQSQLETASRHVHDRCWRQRTTRISSRHRSCPGGAATNATKAIDDDVLAYIGKGHVELAPSDDVRRLPRDRAEQRTPARVHRWGDRRDGRRIRRAQRDRVTLRHLVRVRVPRGCRSYTPDQRFWIAATTRARYSDGSIICGKPAHPAHDNQATTNPAVVVEVLSPSSEGDDDGDKRRDFQSLASLEAYVIAAQDARSVKVYRRTERGE